MKPSVLCYIPARGGSKRIPGKNARNFLGKPLIEYTIEQAQKLDFVDKIVVDTDSQEIADIARACGAEVPYLRPTEFSGDDAKVIDAMLYMLEYLAQGGYKPEYFLILQTTSPLREVGDIEACWERMKKGDAEAVVTVCPAHPQLYNLAENGDLVLANREAASHTNTQAWKEGYILNGCFAYMLKTSILLEQKKILVEGTKAVVCPRWRSVDLDTPEDWVMAEFLYSNKERIEEALKNFS